MTNNSNMLSHSLSVSKHQWYFSFFTIGAYILFTFSVILLHISSAVFFFCFTTFFASLTSEIIKSVHQMMASWFVKLQSLESIFAARSSLSSFVTKETFLFSFVASFSCRTRDLWMVKIDLSYKLAKKSLNICFVFLLWTVTKKFFQGISELRMLMWKVGEFFNNGLSKNINIFLGKYFWNKF